MRQRDIARDRGYNEVSLSIHLSKLRSRRDDVPASTHHNVRIRTKAHRNKTKPNVNSTDINVWDDEAIISDLKAGMSQASICRARGLNPANLSVHLKWLRSVRTDIPNQGLAKLGYHPHVHQSQVSIDESFGQYPMVGAGDGDGDDEDDDIQSIDQILKIEPELESIYPNLPDSLKPINSKIYDDAGILLDLANGKSQAAICRSRGLHAGNLSTHLKELRKRGACIMPVIKQATVEWDDEAILKDLAYGKTPTSIAKERGYRKDLLNSHIAFLRNTLLDQP
jgi:hypothetical protein